MQEEKYYHCTECGLHYAEKEWAVACAAWCKEHATCNLEITSRALVDNKQNEPRERE